MRAPNLGGRTSGHDVSLVEDGDSVAKALSVVQNVRGEDHAFTAGAGFDHEVTNFPRR